MTSEGLGKMFEGDFVYAEFFSLMLMVGRAERLACADPVTRTPIGVSGNSLLLLLSYSLTTFFASSIMLDLAGNISSLI